MPLERARLLWPLLTQGDTSLDARPAERESLGERLVGSAPTPEAELAAAEQTGRVRARMKTALASLSERERKIVRWRFLSDEPRTLEQIGRDLGVSKERVRQLEERIRAKLRLEFAEFSPAA